MPPRSWKSTPVMYFAFCGDMIGVPYEFEVGKNMQAFNAFKLFNREKTVQRYQVRKQPVPKMEFSDDSVLTIATAFSVMQSRGKLQASNRINAAKNLKKHAKQYDYLPGGYGTKFVSWANKSGITAMEEDRSFDFAPGKPYQSFGNGAAMRTSAAGWAFNKLGTTANFAIDGSFMSHSHIEALRGAQAVSQAILLARAGRSKAEIKTYLEATFGYDLSKTVNYYREYNQKYMVGQSENCRAAVQMAMAAFLESDNYLDCMANVLNMGGDSDTIGAIAGSISGAMHGMPRWMQKQCDKRLDDYMRKASRKFENYLDSIDNEPQVDDVENALVRSDVEHHVLEQFKNDPKYVPAEDPEYLDLLAKMEATRLFHEKLNAEKNPDTRKALEFSKENILSQLKESIKNAEDFKVRCKDMTACPVKNVEIIDFDGVYTGRGSSGKRLPNAPKMFPDETPEVQHEMIPAKIMDGSVFEKVFAEELERSKPALEERARLEAQVKTAMDAQNKAAEEAFPFADDDSIPTEAVYDQTLERMIGEIGKYFPEGQVPEQLQGLAADLEKLKAAQKDDYELIQDLQEAREKLPKDDPDVLAAAMQKKLQSLSEEMMGKLANGMNAETMDQLAFVNRLANTVGRVREAPIREQDVYDKDMGALDDFRDNLKAARTTFNSDQYKLIISTLKEMQKPGPAPVSKNEHDTDIKTLTPKQNHVAKLYAVQYAIDLYLRHKSRDGVNANTYHKLAAVEELNQFITKRISDLKPKNFVYLGKKLPDEILPKVESKFNKADISKNVEAALNSGIETYDAECIQTLSCMERIISLAGDKAQNALVDMQNKFFREPGPQEARKAEAANTLTAGKKKQEQIAKEEDKQRREKEKIAKREEEKLRKEEEKRISALEKQKNKLVKDRSKASSDMAKYNPAYTGRGSNSDYDWDDYHAANSTYEALSADIQKIEKQISEIKKQQEERQAKKNQPEEKQDQGNKSQEKSNQGKQSGFVKK